MCLREGTIYILLGNCTQCTSTVSTKCKAIMRNIVVHFICCVWEGLFVLSPHLPCDSRTCRLCIKPVYLDRIFKLLRSPGAQESIPPGYMGWRVDTTTRFLVPIKCSKIPAHWKREYWTTQKWKRPEAEFMNIQLSLLFLGNIESSQNWGFCMDFLNHREGGIVSIGLSSFLL